MKTERVFSTLYKNIQDKEQESSKEDKYTYKLFIKRNYDLEFDRNMTRKEFEDFRKEHNINFNVPGRVSFRNAEGTKYAVLEYEHFKPNLYPMYEDCKKQLLDAFIEENNITKVDEFVLFFEEYVETYQMGLVFNISWFEQFYSDLCSIDKSLLDLFK